VLQRVQFISVAVMWVGLNELT